jgi:DNA polymerase-3 subunit gamma/tau
VDFGQFLAGLGEILRAQLSVALGGEAADVSDHARKELAARRESIAASDLLRMLNAIGEMEIRFKRSGQQQLLIETLLVRFALFDRTVSLEDVLKAIREGDVDAGGGPGGGGRSVSAGARSPGSARVPSAPSKATSGASVDKSLARDVVIESRSPRSAPDLSALTGRWDDLVARVRTSGKALMAAALEASSPQAITKSGDLTIKLDELNDFHAKAIEQDAAIVLGILREWFDGVERIALYKTDADKVADKPKRVTDEMVKSERLHGLRRKDPNLDAAVEVLDLEIAD